MDDDRRSTKSYTPGAKAFDFYIDQVSYKPDARAGRRLQRQLLRRARRRSSRSRARPSRDATTFADLKGYKLGAQLGTTSYDYIVNKIQPDEQPAVFDEVRRRDPALTTRQIDGYVVDPPTALRGRPDRAEVKNGVVVGQFPTDRTTQEHFGLVLRQGQLARRLREPGARRAHGGRHARRDRGGVALRRTSTSPDLAVARRTTARGGKRRQADRTDRRPDLEDAGPTLADPRRAGAAPEGARGVCDRRGQHGRFFTVLSSDLVNSPGWPKVKEAFFNPATFRDYFPDRHARSCVNIKLFLVAEVLILTLALLLAVLRSLPGPVFFPIRALAIVYIDLFRGIPTILVFYCCSGSASRPCRSPRRRSRRSSGRWSALVLIYYGVRGGGLPGRHRLGAPQPGGGGPLARPHPGADACGTLILPQAVRRVIPPLLNDFIGLQKDTALVAVHGPGGGASSGRRSTEVATFNFTPYVVAAFFFVLITVPQARFTDWLVARDRKRQQAGGRV